MTWCIACSTVTVLDQAGRPGSHLESGSSSESFALVHEQEDGRGGELLGDGGDRERRRRLDRPAGGEVGEATDTGPHHVTLDADGCRATGLVGRQDPLEEGVAALGR